MKRALILGMVICMTLMAGIAWSADLYVPGDYSNIQSAINAAETGDTVLVADGIYTGVGNKNIDFGGKALTVRSANGPGNCIIDCEGSGRGFYFYKGKGNPVVQGFTITGGVADNGGGIYCYSSSPTITNCTISGNSADSGFGGGIYCESSSTTITDCTISGNSAFAGGGIFCYPGATIITNCTINGNSVIYYGGGIFCGYSSPLITNCTISGNRAGYGGGIFCQYSFVTITNCTISGNRTDYSGGGIHHFGSDATITNSILWNDTPNEITFSENNPIVKYSDVQGGWVGEGNIDQDPKFVSPLNDYHLQEGSPCIDAGTTAGAPPFDKDGNPRVGNPDMGAYEYQVDTTPPMMLLNDPSPSVLWPPNHKFVDVTITGEVFDFCDPELYIGVSVAVIDAEGRSGGPDYNLLEARIDASGNIYILVSLRAERSGTNSGRTYEVTVTVTDDSGNSTSKAVQVIVPHDQGKKK